MVCWADIAMNLRSPFLSPPPPAPPPAKTALARILFVLAAALVSVPWILISSRAFNRGHWLYDWHDNGWLVVKGYLYTLHYPWSVGWLGFGAMITGLVACSLLTGWSFITQPYVFWARLALMHCPTVVIVRLVTLFKRTLKARHAAFMLVAEALREEVVCQFDSNVGPEERMRVCRALIRLTRLYNSLRLIPPYTETDRMVAAVGWTEAAARLRLMYRHDSCRKAVAAEAALLVARIEEVLPPTLKAVSIESWRRAVASSAFSPESLGLDSLKSCAREDEKLARVACELETGQPSEVGKPLAEHGIEMAVHRRLAVALPPRRRALDPVSRALGGWRSRISLSNQPVWDTEQASTGCEGPLSVELALFLAAGVGSEALMGYLESIEAFHFARSCQTSGNQPDANVTAAMQRLDGWFKTLPRPRDFRWVAELQREEINLVEQDWKQSKLAERSPNQSEADKTAFLQQVDFLHAIFSIRMSRITICITDKSTLTQEASSP